MKWIKIEDLQEVQHHWYQEVLLFDGKDIEYGCIYWNEKRKKMIVEHEVILKEKFTHFIPFSEIPAPSEFT